MVQLTRMLPHVMPQVIVVQVVINNVYLQHTYGHRALFAVDVVLVRLLVLPLVLTLS